MKRLKRIWCIHRVGNGTHLIDYKGKLSERNRQVRADKSGLNQVQTCSTQKRKMMAESMIVVWGSKSHFEIEINKTVFCPSPNVRVKFLETIHEICKTHAFIFRQSCLFAWTWIRTFKGALRDERLWNLFNPNAFAHRCTGPLVFFFGGDGADLSCPKKVDTLSKKSNTKLYWFFLI